MYKVLTYISAFSVLVPLTTGLVKIKTLTKPMWVLLALVLFSALTELFSYVFKDLSISTYYLIQNTYSFIEAIAIAIVLLSGFKKVHSAAMILALLGSLMLLVVLFIKFLFEPNSLLSITESVILIIISVSFFYRIEENVEIQRLTELNTFWLNSGVLLYFATTLILFFFDDFLQHCTASQFHRIWSLHLFGNILFNTSVSLTFWKTVVK